MGGGGGGGGGEGESYRSQRVTELVKGLFSCAIIRVYNVVLLPRLS